MPINWRPDTPGMVDAWHALYGFMGNDLTGDHLKQAQALKERVQKEKGGAYPAWVLDQMGVAVMMANRVTMGSSIQPPRFRWVPYADALLFPLDNSKIAAENSDRKSFFALEEIVRRRYLDGVGLKSVPRDARRIPGQGSHSHARKPAHRRRPGGEIEAAYLRSLAFDRVDRAAAHRNYAQIAGTGAPDDAAYKPLEDFLFRFIASECGRLGMAVHIHTMAGAGMAISTWRRRQSPAAGIAVRTTPNCARRNS